VKTTLFNLMILSVLLFPASGLAEGGDPTPWDGNLRMSSDTDVWNSTAPPPEQANEPIQSQPDEPVEEEDVQPSTPAPPSQPTSQKQDNPTDIEEGLSGMLLAIPELEWTTPASIVSQWIALTRIQDPALQLKVFYRSTLLHRACVGLIDFRQKAKTTRHLKLNFRDDYRGRSWAQPQLAETLILAAKRLRRKHKDVRIMIGDISQPGCGPLMYGELVRFIEDTNDGQDATELLNRAIWHYGSPVALQTSKRRGKLLTRESRILAHRFNSQGHLQLRLTESRTLSLGPVKKRKRRKTLNRLAERLPNAILADSRRVAHQLASGQMKRVWRQHWIWPSKKRQLVSFSRRKIDPNTPLDGQIRPIISLRFSGWHKRKPGAFKNEVRWTRKAGKSIKTSRWARARVAREAGHQTHVDGRDADISYVNKGNELRFMKASKVLDTEKTWAWFKLLEKSAKKKGTSLQRILVSGSIKRRLKKTLSRQTKRSHLYRKVLRTVSGHSAHHHIRVAPAAEPEFPIAFGVWSSVRTMWTRLVNRFDR
jgi:hypothetical protein